MTLVPECQDGCARDLQCHDTIDLYCPQRIVPTRNPSSLRASDKTLAFRANFRIDDTEEAKFGRHFENRYVG
jgi:hypothetical protein